MDRFWLVTWTCYGHWLPGDPRGFVGNIRDDDGSQIVHNIPGTPYDEDLPRLETWVREQMKGEPLTLGQREAEGLIDQFQETARVRQWQLEATSVMFNHTHLVVAVMKDPDPKAILATFKSWATRAVKSLRTLPPNGTFWTENGSKRKLSDENAVRDAVIYVIKKQPNPLAMCWNERWDEVLRAYDKRAESHERTDQ